MELGETLVSRVWKLVLFCMIDWFHCVLFRRHSSGPHDTR